MARSSNTEDIPATHRTESAKKAWFELYARPAVERNRAFLLFILVLLAFTSLSWTIILLIPRHTDVPFIVEVNPKTGTPITRPIQITTAFTPNHLEIQYFAARWLRDLFTINPALTMKYITHDYTETTGNGTREFKAWEAAHQPISQMEKKPGLNADAKILSTSFMGAGNLFVRVAQTRHGINHTSQRIWNCTISYLLIPPATVEQAYQNPIGFTIREFTCTRSLANPT